MESRKCNHCGKEFTGNKKKIFCSDLCRKYAHGKKNIAIVKTYVESKEPTIEILSEKFPGIPERLLKRANKISILQDGLKVVATDKGREVLQMEILRLQDIMDLEMDLEDLIPNTREEILKRRELNDLLEKEKELYARRKIKLAELNNKT